MRYLRLGALCLVCLAAAQPGLAAEKVIFGTLGLSHATAGELLGVLGDAYRPVDQPGPAAGKPIPDSTAWPGVKFVTMAAPGSQLLVGYGTEKGLAKLQEALKAADVAKERPGAPPDRVRVSMGLRDALPRSMSDWSAGPQMGGLKTQYHDYGESASLTYRRSRSGKMFFGSAFAIVPVGTPEVMALPKLGSLQQILLALQAQLQPDGKLALAIGAAETDPRDPWKAVAEAVKLPLAVTVVQRQQLGVALMRGDSGMTLMFSASKVEPEPPSAQ